MYQECLLLQEGKPYDAYPPVRTWRELLGRIIEDRQKKQELALTLNVASKTLERWAAGISHPRPYNLSHLVQALPEVHQQLMALIALEDPQALGSVSSVERAPHTSSETAPTQETGSTLGDVLSARVLEDRANGLTSASRWGVWNLILTTAALHLDQEHRRLSLLLALCVPPDPDDGLVHTVREEMVECNQWWTAPRPHLSVPSIESLVGHLISCGTPFVAQNRQELFWEVPEEMGVGCVAGYPLRTDNRVAGCVLVLSALPDAFGLSRVDLLRRSANLLALCLPDQAFFPLSQISVRGAPDPAVQQAVLAHFERQVDALLAQAQRQQQSLKRNEAEALLLAQLQGRKDLPHGSFPL